MSGSFAPLTHRAPRRAFRARLFRSSYEGSPSTILDSVLMVLTILMAWLGLAVLAAFFVYCCSRVSNGERREPSDDDIAPEPPRPLRGRGAKVSATWAMPTAYERRRSPRPVAAGR